MKLAKLSLAAMVVAGLASSSFAADTLADAFKNGKVNGELRAWYFDREGSATADPALAATKAFYVIVRLSTGSSVERPITNKNVT